MVPGTTTALIQLEQFSNGAADDMVQTLKAARAAGADRLVLDMRGNPGGYVNEAVGVASQFLSKGLVYIERNAAGDETQHPVSAGGVATDLPLVVVVDGHGQFRGDRVGCAAGRGPRQGRRRDDVRHRDRPRRVRPVRWVGAPGRAPSNG